MLISFLNNFFCKFEGGVVPTKKLPPKPPRLGSSPPPPPLVNYPNSLEDELSVNFERIIESIFDNMEAATTQSPPKSVTSSQPLTPAEEESFTENMEQKPVTTTTGVPQLVNQQLNYGDEPDPFLNLPSSSSAISGSASKSKSATMPIVVHGKPPKPPSAKNYQGKINH